MRFGAVSYLNARPLIEGLAPLVLDTPAQLADRMEAGELDVALLPVAAGERLGLARVGSLGIAAEGKVDSVLVFVQREPVRTIRLDPASRTSRILARLIYRERFDLDPEPVEEGADAELIIGDAALDREGPALDLAEEWTAWTGLPFVFAAWYGDPESAPALAAAYERGREQLANYASGDRLEYLRDRIRFEIGPREEEGLARFLELARAHRFL
ncbi:MAG: menaquinone biosynthetic enzyme MqnA/MqnD family protein [Planctomycetota bacterium]